MSKEDNGGPAFPVIYKQCIGHDNNGQIIYSEDPIPGMPLRDYFASKAPVTVQDAIDVSGYKDRDCLKHDADRNVVFAVLTMMRYEYADAMLSERKR